MADSIFERILARSIFFLLEDQEGICVEIDKGRYVVVKEDGVLNCYNFDENKDSLFEAILHWEDGRRVVFIDDDEDGEYEAH